ncbi:MAG: UbiD family decarboxylase, partial [Gammaproteobacteria bacterium]|nr:UbiD family decarboxylase [Gammaproteobacteria bacterium]
MEPKSQWAAQDFRAFLADYRRAWPDDVLTFEEPVSSDQDITAVIWRLADDGRAPMLHFKRVDGLGVEVAANVFASRARIARILGAPPERLHEAYQARARDAKGQRVVSAGPILDQIDSDWIDLGRLPMLKHFETDRARYITSGVIVAEHPQTGAGNLSYHRAMIHSSNALATSLH